VLLGFLGITQSQGFATITIQRARSGEAGDARLRVLPNGDVAASSVPVVRLLNYAYDVPINPSSRLLGLPDWASRERYDIQAKANANAISPGLQGRTFRNRVQQMVRGLLADRFGLLMRVENKRTPVYALTVAGGGAKLQRSAIAERDCGLDTGGQPCHDFGPGLGHPLNGNAVGMDDLANYISNWTDLPVVNHTAISGLFTVDTEGWVPMRLPPPPPNGTPNANAFAGLPTIFSVLGKLGLELARQEEMLPTYTVERIERPTVN
jgi:uncharacterized protein (TIGR03435 family)